MTSMLFMFQLLHVTRPRFYSLGYPPHEEPEKVVADSKLSGGPITSRHTVATGPLSYPNHRETPHRNNNRTESTVLLKNVAIVKNYPNDSPIMLEKLEDMHRLLTNIRRRVNNRRPANVHLRQHR